MPQQPKISNDIETDSWALQTTQELNDVTQRLDAVLTVLRDPANTTVALIQAALEDI